MKRKQIYLEEEQERAIKRIARERGVPEAVIIREAMDSYLAEERAPYDEAGGEGLIGTDRDPILRLIGMIKGGDPHHGSHTYKQDLYGGENGPL